MASYDLPGSPDFPIGGGNAEGTCKRLGGCSPLFPIVVCKVTGSAQASHDQITIPGFSTFIRLFEAPPLLGP